jgi:serine/threonine-protein kinase
MDEHLSESSVEFGKYLLLQRIGAGGMAEVFRAILRGPREFRKYVALKRTLPGKIEDCDFHVRFLAEAEIASQLSHGNIVQVFDFGDVEGVHYLAMELVEGMDLELLLRRLRDEGQQLDPTLAAFVAANAARGLGHAHEKMVDGRPLGLVHRDVSPQNILVSVSGEVKLADFGIATATSEALVHRPKTTISVVGKLRYMSPEQVNGQPLDGRSDIFSLGMVLHLLLTGRMPFNARHPGEVAEQIRRGNFAPPSSLRPEIPASLDCILMSALAVDRDARYQRASDFARDLSEFVAENSPGTGPEELAALIGAIGQRAQSPNAPARSSRRSRCAPAGSNDAAAVAARTTDDSAAPWDDRPALAPLLPQKAQRDPRQR